MPIKHSSVPTADVLQLPAASSNPMATRLQRLAIGAVTLGIPVATIRDKRFLSRRRISARGHVIEGNGFEEAFVTLGRAVFVDVVRFEEIMRLQGSSGHGN